MSVKEKSIGQLLDELSIVNVKIFWHMETIAQSIKSGDKVKHADASTAIVGLNKTRRELVAAIDEYLGDRSSQSGVTY